MATYFELKCKRCGCEGVKFQVSILNNVPDIKLVCMLCGSTEHIHASNLFVTVVRHPCKRNGKNRAGKDNTW